MNSSQNIAEYSTERAAGEWLRQRVVQEAGFQIVDGMIVGLFGLIVLAVTSFVLLWILFFLCGRHLWDMTHFVHWKTAVVFFLLMWVVLFWGAYKSRADVDYYTGGRVGWTTPVFSENFTSRFSMLLELLFGGPRLLFAAGDSFRKASRLLYLDIPQVTDIILWIWRRDRKTSVQEVMAHFPRCNIVRILPQMRDIPGIIWLSRFDEIILLSETFRRDLGRVIVPNAQFQEEAQAQNFSQEEPRFNDQFPSSEVMGWYKILGLPPFAPVHEVKRKYRFLAKKYHPDTNPGEENADRFKQINEAYHNIIKSHTI